MSTQYGQIGTLLIALTLVVGCGEAQSAGTCVPPAATPASLLCPDLSARASVNTCGGDLHDYLYDILLLDDGGILLAGRPAGARAPVAQAITVDTIEQVVRLHTVSGPSDADPGIIVSSSDGSLLASGGYDDVVCVWSIPQ